jgi:hypothetical protein
MVAGEKAIAATAAVMTIALVAIRRHKSGSL